MAKNTAVQVLDDLTGEPAAETVGFGLDGIDYDIDLSFANADTLRVLLQRYADAGRRTGGRKNRPRLVPGAKKAPAAKAAPAKTARAASGKAAATKTVPAKAAPAKTAPAKTAPAKAAPTKTASTRTARTNAKTTTTKATRAKAEPAQPARAKKAAETKSTREAARKVPTVTFSAAE
ncbi:histone-like nucleoid-structuring protein Lsr2 [Amycolatopsis sp. lyj-23]|uniref:Lsr2 dimerization domain-containing protein n=1 Tax=Amycolatopsis sp. lyj-23 TaxID=2789283 RepID=UPI003978EEC7